MFIVEPPDIQNVGIAVIIFEVAIGCKVRIQQTPVINQHGCGPYYAASLLNSGV